MFDLDLVNAEKLNQSRKADRPCGVQVPAQRGADMTEHNFTLILEGDVDGHADELYEAGLDDALLGEVNGIPYAEFDREAPDLLQAIASAIAQVRSMPDLDVIRVEPEEYLTQAEIAQRTGKSREAIRLLATGQRGRGDFPRPSLRQRDRSPLWRWSEIIAWTSSDPVARATAAALGALNAQLEYARLVRSLPDEQAEILSELTTTMSPSDRDIEDALRHMDQARARLNARGGSRRKAAR